VAKRNASVTRLEADLRALSASVPEDLFVPSLRAQPPRLRGHAFRFYHVLPMYCAEGRPVFTYDHLSHIYRLFDDRFAGCLAPTSRSGAPFFGEYQPEGTKPVRDYLTVVTVYANPIEASDRFFQELKEILRKAPLIPQDEILIERSEVYLV
jgi:hypothetical protein